MKSIADYFEGTEGTVPARNKRFKLYGLDIGIHMGVSEDLKLIFMRDNGERMLVPITVQKLHGFELNGKPSGPIANPVMAEILEI